VRLFRLGFQWVAVLAALSGTEQARAQGLHLIPGVEEIASDSIQDLAIALVDEPVPVIYYNPILVRRYGPDVARFLLAHEYGHIFHRHTRAGLADLPPDRRDSMLQQMELEADCYAAGQRGEPARVASEAAIRFFTRLGPFRFDNQHPTGAQRVARILACLPEPLRDDPATRGDTGFEAGPVGGEPSRVRFRVSAPAIAEADYGNEALLWVDGQPVGRVSNMRFPRELAVDRFGAGIHSYRLTLELFRANEMLQFLPLGQVTGQGHFTIQDGDRFSISWRPGRSPALVKVERAPD
jgi:hypothetical protein